MSVFCRTLCKGLVIALVLAGDDIPAGEASAAAEASPAAGKDSPSVKADKAVRHEVKEQSFRIEVTLSGAFKAREAREISLRPDAWSGLVVERAVEHGTRVRKGDLLLVCEREGIDKAIVDLETSLKLGRLDLKKAESDLAALEDAQGAELAALERSARESREDLDRFVRSGRAFDRKVAEAALEDARNYLEYQEEELRQLEKMYLADDLTEETEEIILKRQRDTVRRAEFRLKSAERDLERTVNVWLPRSELTMRENAKDEERARDKGRVSLAVNLQKARLELEKKKRDLERSSERLRKLRRDVELLTVESPSDGIVYYGRCVQGSWSDSSTVAAKLRPGATVQPKEVVMTIVVPRPLRILAKVPEKELGKLRAGIRGTARPTGYSATRLPVVLQDVSAIPVSPGTFLAELRVELDEDDRAILPGMTCKVHLVSYSREKAVVIPATALHMDDQKVGKPWVRVRKDKGKVEKREVTPGRRSGKTVEILRGLKPGEVILLDKPRGDS